MAKSGCPNCGKTPDDKYRPFCSKHCADVDLGKWLLGAYAIPVEENGFDEDSGIADDEDSI